MNYYDVLAKDLRLALAHCAEHQPPLIVASCVCGKKNDGKWGYLLSICVPTLSMIAEWQSEPDKEITEMFAECRNLDLIPSVAMRFFIPSCVIEKNGIRSAVNCCIEHIEAAISGKLPTDEIVLGVPQYYIALMILQ